MRLASFVVVERVEDPECRVVHAEAIPDPGARFLLDDLSAALEERLDRGLLARFGLDQCQDSQGERHLVLLRQ